MKKLKSTLRKNGFDYTLVERINNAAIYLQSLDDKIIAYEVFKIRTHSGYEIAGKTIEPGEIFPKNNDFGKTAWSYRSCAKAVEKFKELTDE